MVRNLGVECEKPRSFSQAFLGVGRSPKEETLTGRRTCMIAEKRQGCVHELLF